MSQIIYASTKHKRHAIRVSEVQHWSVEKDYISITLRNREEQLVLHMSYVEIEALDIALDVAISTLDSAKLFAK